EAVYRHQHAEVAILVQADPSHALAGIYERDSHYDQQVRHDQPTGRVQIRLILQPVSQLALFLDTQYRDTAYGLNIGLQVGTWRKVMYGLQSSAHVWTPES